MIQTLPILFTTLVSAGVFAHSGGLDSNGGHHNRMTGEYHCHRDPCASPTANQPASNPLASRTPVASVESSDDPTLTEAREKCNGHLLYGIPKESDQLLCRRRYALGFNYSRKSADWVAYRLTPEIHNSGSVQRRNDFRADQDLPAIYRKQLGDFEEPVFDRGHLANSASLDATVSMNSETFLLSNMIPQLPGLNRAAWLGLENRERKWTDQRGELYVYTGVLFEGDRLSFIGNRVPIPTHFFKVIYDPEGIR